MRPEVIEVVRGWYAANLADQKIVLEIGANDVNGSVRPLFTGEHEYTGIDMRDGDGVDLVANAHELPFDDGHADAVVCIDMMEHDDAFWLTVDEIHRVLKSDGIFVLCVPSIGFRVFHPHPDDFWRFTTSAFQKILMRRFEMIEMREIATYDECDTIIGIARRW